MKIYLAGTLFSEAERDWMKKLNRQIESPAAESSRTVQTIWPCEFMAQKEIGTLAESAKHEIFSRRASLISKTPMY
ncbi:MAG: hypothetical protein ABSH41_18700 [Syntrophobacteraceae bacterium]|jgi:nucleoside 2-deoxyribosyltransferase